MAKDYYAILGVDKGVSQDDIKKVFRQKAKQYHPDINDDPTSEQKFKEINEAYSVLSDPEKRRMYDMGGLNFDGARGGGSPFDIFDSIFNDFFRGGFRTQENFSRRTAPPVVKVGVNVTLKDVYDGVKKEVKYHRSKICSECNGSGSASSSGWETCSECGGTGVKQKVINQGGFGVRINTPCQKCGGNGKILKEPCRICGGRSYIDAHETLEVDIPRGIGDRQVIRVEGRGHQINPNQFGDLWCVVQILDDDNFKRDGNNLLMNKAISLKQALLGGEMSINLLDGTVEQIKLHAPIQPNTSMTLKGKGMPDLNVQYTGKYGDMIIALHIKMPHLSKTQMDGLEKIL